MNWSWKVASGCDLIEVGGKCGLRMCQGISDKFGKICLINKIGERNSIYIHMVCFKIPSTQSLSKLTSIKSWAIDPLSRELYACSSHSGGLR